MSRKKPQVKYHKVKYHKVVWTFQKKNDIQEWTQEQSYERHGLKWICQDGFGRGYFDLGYDMYFQLLDEEGKSI